MNEIIEKLAREISLCFRYYSVTFRGAKPKEAILSGGESYESHLVKALASQLGIDVRVSQPLRGIDLTRVSFSFDNGSPLCEWAVATGLGARNWNVENCEIQNHERN
jgi:type IV pilus assembly protein PilM